MPADTTAPTILKLDVKDIKARSAIIWSETDKSVSLKIEYDTNNLRSPKLYTYDGFSTVYSATLTELDPNTIYYYRITARDSAGNESTSEILTFKTKTIGSLTVSSIAFEKTTLDACTIDAEVFKIRLTASPVEDIKINKGIHIGIPDVPFSYIGLYVDGVITHEKDFPVQTAHDQTLFIYNPVVVPAGGYKDFVVKVNILCGVNWKGVGLNLHTGSAPSSSRDIQWGSDYTGKYDINAMGVDSVEQIYVSASGPLYGPLWDVIPKQ